MYEARKLLRMASNEVIDLDANVKEVVFHL